MTSVCTDYKFGNKMFKTSYAIDETLGGSDNELYKHLLYIYKVPPDIVLLTVTCMQAFVSRAVDASK